MRERSFCAAAPGGCDRSAREAAALPVPRSLHGRVIDRLRKAGVWQIAYDVQLTEQRAQLGNSVPGLLPAAQETSVRGRTASIDIWTLGPTAVPAPDAEASA